ncbi:MAX gene-associated protein isoform X2 [Gouania willdenowi]|uniref:MAX gene-associated protein isoform X2 n=1 Tax=Gouania willdenowi TaxID=441366 RepID=UPI001054C9A5|nr:MAX gene-associated protein-like isoform X2 [Gouania willdenowi]
MEDHHAEGDEQESWLSVLFSSPPPFLSSPEFSSDILSESKALSMANNDCSSALSSPTEASPAKPDRTASLFDRSATSPPTSPVASASENVVSRSQNIITIVESSPSLPLPSFPFGTPNQERDLPSTLTINGVSVTLENESVWKQFYSCGTEMVLTKGGRRMFPYCRYRLTGLDPNQLYSLILSIVPFGPDRYHWIGNNWKVLTELKHSCQGPCQAFSHHHEPYLGSVWMCGSVSFYKLKLTNHSQDMDEHIVLHSLHRYIPRLHVVPVSDKQVPSPDNCVTLGPETMTFIFPQTEFVTVTTYQNFQITQLKINHNPFAKGFREDGKNPRLQRLSKIEQKPDAGSSVLNPVDSDEKETALDLSLKKTSVAEETKLVLKPIMSTSASDPYTVCMHGKPSLAELVFVDKPEQKEAEMMCVNVNPEVQNDSNAPTWSETPSVSKTPATSTPASSSKFFRKRKRVNKRWGNSKGKEWYRKEADAKVLNSPLMSNTFPPELDEVEGVLFVSFPSKDALECHMKDEPSTHLSPSAVVSPSTPTESTQTDEPFTGVLEEENVETEQDKITRLESILLEDLRTFKHKQVIHPVLQEVGLKLSLLDTTREIDLQYLGVCLPLPLTDIQDQTSLSSGDDGSSFISRTGKTSDVTKIKGWKTKFSKSKEISPTKNEGLPKNLSAFCSDLLDEYLESEAQQITERAAAFSTHLEDSVSYQLPVKSSSYVKTLDSALKHRNTASKIPVGAKRPYQLSSKASASSAVMSSPPPTMCPAEASTRMCPSQPEEHPSLNVTQSPGVTQKPGLIKILRKMLQMEAGALNRGLLGTKLTQERLTVALSVMLTKQTEYGHVVRVAEFPTKEDIVPACTMDFCRLGCVCSSLQTTRRRRLHCGRTECMLGCTCFKRRIKKHLTAVECEQQILPVYSLTYSENLGPPRPGCHSNELWNSSMADTDPEPHFSYSSSSLSLIKGQKHNIQLQHPVPPEMPDEDKDPVYKYFESMMTCARVREFNSKPPPELTIEPKMVAPPTSTPKVKTEDTMDTQPKDDTKNQPVIQKSEKTSPGAGYNVNKARTKIQILSTCSWDEDRIMVLKALCERMSQNRLDKDFYIGPYCVNPINKVLIQKPNGKLVTYRVRISKQSKDSDSEEYEHGDNKEDLDDGLVYEQEETFAVTPFMRGVIPAGKLKAVKKTPGADTQGLVQVNDKSYSQARLLLGNIGSLHPANRLAAYVTGRLPAPSISQKIPGQPKSNSAGSLHKKPEEPVVQPAPSTSNSTGVKSTPKLSAPDLGKIGLNTCSQPPPQINPKLYPLSSTVSNQHGFSTILQSPLSLTVSPSLKSPSFLGDKGTCSFRIFPPSIEGSSNQRLPGVSLPGGYTLIQLSGPEADVNPVLPKTTGKTSVGHLAAEPGECRFSQAHTKQPHFETLSKGGPGSSIKMILDEKVSAGVSEASDNSLAGKQVEPLLVDSSSDSLDESEEDDEFVDIETIEESQVMAVSRIKKASHELIREDESDEYDAKRNTHTVVERLRRCEQRILFEKLQTVLRKDDKTPKLVLLSEAREEIESLVVTSKILVKMKRMLTAVQSAHVKKLSLLSGKSETQIRNKMLEISLKQKMRMRTDTLRPSFSRLGQFQAVAQQATSPVSAPTLHQKLSTAVPSSSQSLSEFKHSERPDMPNDKSDESERQATKDKDGDSSETKITSQGPSKFFSFPLVRSKNGRIILPSCMQQLGKNLVTFRLVKFKKTGEGVKSDSPENLETNTSASDPQLDAVFPLSENQSASTNNQSILVPSMEMFTGTDGDQSKPIVYLESSTSPKDGPISGGKRYFMIKPDLRHNKISTLVKQNVEKSKTNAANEDRLTKNHPHAKRRRGRPPKRKSDLESSGPVKKANKALSKDKKDRTVSYTKFPGEPSKSRPLTRGSLGKDFPSAKKQSWIDLERELEDDSS